MIRIAGMWELGWNTPIKEMDYWEVIVREFHIDKFYMTPISGIDSKYVIEKKRIEEILEENKNFDKVFVDINGDTELQSFIHPKNALYVFGRTGRGTDIYNNGEGITLRLDTIEGNSMLWPPQVCSIILYDRMIKNGSNSK